jgi:hypothetical protein
MPGGDAVDTLWVAYYPEAAQIHYRYTSNIRPSG